MRSIARSLLQGVRRARDKLRLRRISSSTPLSRVSGYDRGTPIDRHYIEQFLADHSGDIRGRVLEVGDDTYARKFGGGRVTRQDILHIDRSNRAATIVGDLSNPQILPANTYDCIILTQTLQYVFDLPAALKQLRSALRPSGVLLVTVPGLAPVSLDDWQDSYYWRFTLRSLERLLSAAFDPAEVETLAFGNLYAAINFLRGAAVEEVNKERLREVMPEYAIVITARAVG